MKTYRLPAVALTGLLMSGAAALAQDQQQQPAQQGQQQAGQRDREQSKQGQQAVRAAAQQQQSQQECPVCAAKAASGGSAESIQQAIAKWPETPKKVAQKMMEQYGPPSGVMPSRLIWNNPQKGPWAEIILSRDEVQHDFPMKHTDVLEQVIYYDVPVDKVEELAKYDGSVIVERTKGTLSARCDKEAANFLALNLAHDIITGKENVEEARQAYAQAIQQSMKGQMPETMQKLMFEPKSKQQAGYTDEAVMKKGQ
ncbi:MAG TPA: hypothetical protein VGR35_09800 [Tepidisphaeraceae bacterium]|nr:hypothetical protein [Tepidisphaeraceae bacterium]